MYQQNNYATDLHKSNFQSTAPDHPATARTRFAEEAGSTPNLSYIQPKDDMGGVADGEESLDCYFYYET